MPVLANNATGGVIYTPGALNSGLIVANDQVNTTETLASVADIKIAVGKYERIVFRYNLFALWDATADIEYQVDIPASPTKFFTVTAGSDGSTTAVGQAPIVAEAAQSLTTGSANGLLIVHGFLDNGANAGHLDFQFCMRAGGTSTTIQRGSYLEYQKF